MSSEQRGPDSRSSSTTASLDEPTSRFSPTPPLRSSEVDTSSSSGATASEEEVESDLETKLSSRPSKESDISDGFLNIAAVGDLVGLINSSPFPPAILSRIAESAAKNDQPTILSWTFTAGLQLSKDSNNDPIYNAACRSGSIEIFQVLVDHGLDLNSFSSEHYGDALTYACVKEDVPLVKWLLENGHDPNLGRRFSNKLAIVWAATSPPATSLDLLSILLKHDIAVENTGAAIAAAEKDNLEALILLLNAGAGLEEAVAWWGSERQSNSEVGTALFRACMKGRARTVEYLLGRGADKDTEGSDGSNCWDVAEKGRFVDVQRLLDYMGTTVEWPD